MDPTPNHWLVEENAWLSLRAYGESIFRIPLEEMVCFQRVWTSQLPSVHVPIHRPPSGEANDDHTCLREFQSGNAAHPTINRKTRAKEHNIVRDIHSESLLVCLSVERLGRVQFVFCLNLELQIFWLQLQGRQDLLLKSAAQISPEATREWPGEKPGEWTKPVVSVCSAFPQNKTQTGIGRNKEGNGYHCSRVSCMESKPCEVRPDVCLSVKCKINQTYQEKSRQNTMAAGCP